MKTAAEKEEICCPKFEPEPWRDRTFEWKDKKFIKGRVRTFFNIPINFGGVIKRLDRQLKAAGAECPDWMCLSEHTSRWNMDLYLAVDKNVPDVENTSISGTFFSSVYEGPYKDTGKWCKDFEAKLNAKGQDVDKWYMWYTTCPKCAKKYGKNYVVLLTSLN